MPPEPPTTRICPECSIARRLVYFRRWSGRHRSLHDVCNVCQPQRRLSQMNGKQRDKVQSMDLPFARGKVVSERIYNSAPSVLNKLSVRRERNLRIQMWRAGLLDALKRDRTWARENKRVLELTDKASVSLGGWQSFFALYYQILARMCEDAAHAASKARTRPTSDDLNPMNFCTQSELRELLALYSACRVRRSDKAYRAPWCLSWSL